MPNPVKAQKLLEMAQAGKIRLPEGGEELLRGIVAKAGPSAEEKAIAATPKEYGSKYGSAPTGFEDTKPRPADTEQTRYVPARKYDPVQMTLDDLSDVSTAAIGGARDVAAPFIPSPTEAEIAERNRSPMYPHGRPLLGSREQVDAAQARHPMFSAAGGVLGSLPQMGAAGGLQAGLSEALGLARTAQVVPGVLKGAATGAGSYVGAETARSLARGEDPSDNISAAGLAVSGGLGGAAGGGQALARGLRMTNPDLKTIEDAWAAEGKGPPLLDARKPPPRIQEILDETFDVKASPDNPTPNRNPVGTAVDRVAPEIASRAEGRNAFLTDARTKLLDAYDATPEGKVMLTPNETSKALPKIFQELSRDASGEKKLAFVDRETFGKAINDLVDIRPAKPGDPAAMVITADQAQQMGIKINDAPAVQQATRLGIFDRLREPADWHPGMPENTPTGVGREQKYAIRFVPLTAKKIATVRSAIDAMARADKPSIVPEHHALLMKTIRQDLNRYPWAKSLGPEPTATLDDGTPIRGVSAVEHEFSKMLEEAQHYTKQVGIPGPNASSLDVKGAIRGATARYGQNPETDDALRFLANETPGKNADTLKALSDVRATRAAENLLAGSALENPGLGGGPTFWRGARYGVVDPVGRAAAKAGPKVTVPAGQATRKKQKPPKADEKRKETLTEKLMGLSPFD